MLWIQQVYATNTTVMASMRLTWAGVHCGIAFVAYPHCGSDSPTLTIYDCYLWRSYQQEGVAAAIHQPRQPLALADFRLILS